MAEELQHLIERIQREAVDTGEQKAAELIAQAREKAQSIVRTAEEQAKVLLQRAEQDSLHYTERSHKTLQQAARDVLISVGQGIESIFSKLALEAVGQNLNEALLREMLVKMVEAYAGQSGHKIEVLLNPADREKLYSFFKERFREQLQSGLSIGGDERVLKGFQVSLDGGRVRHQFTAEAIAEALAHFIRPQLAEIVYEVARGEGVKQA